MKDLTNGSSGSVEVTIEINPEWQTDTLSIQNGSIGIDGWIKCSERLPSYKQCVLVYLDTGLDIGIITEAVYRGEYEKDVHIFRIELTREDIENKIMHWMPLPELPEDLK